MAKAKVNSRTDRLRLVVMLIIGILEGELDFDAVTSNP